MRKIKQQVLKHFQKRDKVLFLVAKDRWPRKKLEADKPENYFRRLCREIIGQQLAGHVARVIFSRFEGLFSNKEITPDKVLKISHEIMRKIGLSNAKAKYVRNLAEMIVNKELNFEDLKDFTDEQIITELTKVSGIGPWTAEMFLMFTMAREDVFSSGDLGLRKAIKNIYDLEEMPTIELIERISSKWRPYRTYASLVLWESLNVSD
jgi:DNA-3-methyladenine glycosylase II